MAILEEGSAAELVGKYNAGADGARYNQVARSVYNARSACGVLSPQFEAAIFDGLMGFGIGITIKGVDQP